MFYPKQYTPILGRTHTSLMKTHTYQGIDDLYMLKALKKLDVIYGWSLMQVKHENCVIILETY